jgi:O-antigen ligase
VAQDAGGVRQTTMRGGLSVQPVGAEMAVDAGQRPAAAARPDALIYLSLAIMLTMVWRLHDFIPLVRAMRPSIVLTLASLAFLILQRDRTRGSGRLRSPVTVWLGVLLLLMAAGIPFSLEPAHSARFFTNTIVPFVLAGFVVAASIRSIDDLELLALGALVGGCIYTVILHALLPVDAGGRWIDTLGHYDVNDLALMLVAMFPLTLYFMRRRNGTARRLFAAGCFALFAFSMVKTGSRGGLVGLVAVFAYLLLAYRGVPTRARVLSALAAGALLVAGGRGYWDRMETMFRPSQDYNFSDDDGRIAIWTRGLTYVEQRPLLGLGLDAFRTAEVRISPVARRALGAGRPPNSNVAHNMFLHVAAELGLPALVAFLLLLGSAAGTLLGVGRIYRHSPPDDPVPALAQALLASLLGFVVCGLFLSVAYFPYLQVLLGLTVALGAVARAGLPARRELPRAYRSRGAYGIGGTPANRAVL